MYERPQVEPKFIPPSVISDYVNQWIITSIPNYGQVIAYVTEFNRRNGMVSMFIYQSPYYQPQFIQVHNSDLIGISPYYGPVPPRPSQPPRPPHNPHNPGNPWQPGGGHGGHGTGGGFWPWAIGQTTSTLFGSGQQRD